MISNLRNNNGNMDFDDGFAIGFALGRSKKKISIGSSDEFDEAVEDWYPPSNWLVVPDPKENEIYILVNVISVSGSVRNNDVRLVLCHPETGEFGWGRITIDWGDKRKTDYEEGSVFWTGQLSHDYRQTGQFIIKITTEIGKNNAFIGCYSDTVMIVGQWEKDNVLMCKTGSKIVFSHNNLGNYFGIGFGTKMEYFKHFGNADSIPHHFANGWYGVVKIEFEKPITDIPDYAFQQCYSLRTFDTSEVLSIGAYGFLHCALSINSFPKCKSIGNYAFSYSYIRKINIPECESIGDYAFQNNKIRKLNIPKCKKIGNYAFANSYELISVNAPLCEIIEDKVFYNNWSLTNVIVSDNCILGTDCFYGCPKLRSYIE